MRLVGKFQEEQQAAAFSALLSAHQIDNHFDPKNGDQVNLWVIDEEKYEEAERLYTQFIENPQMEVLPHASSNKKPPKFKVHVKLRPPILLRFTLTNFIIAICIFLFIWTGQQKQRVAAESPLAAALGLIPLQERLYFDFPQAMGALDQLLHRYQLKSLEELKTEPLEVQQAFTRAERIPMWIGIMPLIAEWKETGFAYLQQVKLIEKIRTGEVWRLISPVLLHANVLHILFNMLWVWVLGREMEMRIGRIRMVLFMLVTGVVSNGMQYLMSGPFFIGFSGIIMGMAGFIWMRQKMAPWEGYPVQRSTFIFLFFFVVAMAGLGLLAFILQLLHVPSPFPGIANTAHIAGALMGIALARIPFFSRRPA